MSAPGGPEKESDSQYPSDGYYRELQTAGWVDGPSRLPEQAARSEHLAVVEESNGAQRAFTTQFVRNGLENGSQCLYIRTEDAAPERSSGEFDVDTADTEGEIVPRSVSKMVPGPDGAETDEFLGSLRETIEEVSSSDERTRVVIEMAGLMEMVPFHVLLTYEVRLSELCQKTDSIVLSRFQRENIPSMKVTELLRAYPYIVADGTVCYNTEYLSPAEYFSPRRSDHEVERGVETLVEQTETRLHLDEVERQNDRLKVFANSISHDLRNPLQTAIGRAELLPDDDEQVQVVRDALERMDRIIQDGVQMVEGEEVTDSETASIEDLANQCWGVMNGQDAELTVTEDIGVTGDRSRIQQLLENLFRNSIKYGGTSPSIRVGPIEPIHLSTRADTDEGYTGFFVEDDGPGIPEDRRTEIFELGESGGDGTGYGLTIVKEIAEAHGWTIRVSSSRDGGARFEITGVDTCPTGSRD